MPAHADDLRYFYAEDIGDSIALTAPNGSSGRTPELSPGRYVLRILAFGGASAVWVRQGDDTATAGAAVPSMCFLAHANTHDLNKPLTTFMVRPGRGMKAFIAAYGVGGAGTVQITKVSRDKN